MKNFRFIITFLLILSMLLTACGGEGETTTEPSVSDEVTTTPPETDAPVNTEPKSTAVVPNPNWGYAVHSLRVLDETVVSAELDQVTANVILTSYNPGETEVHVLDCFEHKAIIKVKVADDAECSITFEANPCEEEFINAAKYGVLPGYSPNNLPDQSSKLQAVIDSVSANGGGTIFLYPGFYNIKLLTMREGVTLKMYSGFTDASEGYTPELAEKVKNGEVTVLILTRIINTEYNNYAENGTKNFTLSGGVIDNCHDGQSTLLFGLSENIVVENMVFKDIKNNHVIQITGCNNVTVRNCIFAGFEWGGTFTRETIQIEQSHPGAHGGNIETTPIRFYSGNIHGCNNVVIDSCYFGPSDELPGAHIAIGHHGTAHEAVCDGFKITNNVFDSPTYAAIRFANIVDVDITGNTFIAGEGSNKFCDNADPAFIILYPNTGNVTYENIVNGQKVTKAFSHELSGSHNINISNNEFTVTKGSDKRILIATGTGVEPGVRYQAGVLRQDTYDSQPYKVTGYFKATNYLSNLNFSDNKITYLGQPLLKDCIIKLANVYGYTVEGNEIQLNNCNFKYETDGVKGLYTTVCHTLSDAQTYMIPSKVAKNYVSIPQPDGGVAKLIFTVADTHYIIAGEGGRFELSSDGKGNVIFNVIPDEGYVFDGWITDSGDFTKTGNCKIDYKLTITAKFTKK